MLATQLPSIATAMPTSPASFAAKLSLASRCSQRGRRRYFPDQVFRPTATSLDQELWLARPRLRSRAGHRFRRQHLLLLAEISLQVNFGGEALHHQRQSRHRPGQAQPRRQPHLVQVLRQQLRRHGHCLGIDPVDNISVTGSFEDTINFGGDDLKAKGRSDMYVAKFDTNGKHVWSHSFGGKDKDWGNSIATDALAIATSPVGSGTTSTSATPSLSPRAKRTSSCSSSPPTARCSGPRALADTSLDMGKAVAIDARAGVVTVGAYNQQIDFGGGALTPTAGPIPRCSRATSTSPLHSLGDLRPSAISNPRTEPGLKSRPARLLGPGPGKAGAELDAGTQHQRFQFTVHVGIAGPETGAAIADGHQPCAHASLRQSSVSGEPLVDQLRIR